MFLFECRKSIWRFFAFSLIAWLPTLAISGGVGTTTADILKINSGARPAGMAGVYTAMGDDAYSVSYNPAGLVGIKASQLVLYHLDSLADISYEYLTFVTAFGSDSAMAANVIYRHAPPIDNVPGLLPVQMEDILASFSYAMKLSSNIRAGATLKYVQSTLGPFSPSAMALDLGVQLDRLPFGIKAGLALNQIVGTGMTFNPASESDPLPMFIRAGIGTHQVINIEGKRDFNAGIEIFMPSDQGIKAALGAEFWVFPDLFAIRGGYKFDWSTDPALQNAFQNYTLGCTLTRRLEGDDFSLDIAYNPADFGSTAQDTFFFALNFKFNQLRLF